MSLPIQPLPTDVVDHIAAGEVIDSLAAVVQELAENALDAGATRITLALWPEQWRIRVVDNGWGMVYDDLLQAATPHSTSKIQTQDDLWQIHSLGFRGEALHSLAQVSHLEICSRSQQDPTAPGWRMVYSPQGEVVEVETVAIAPGTLVTVSDLFSLWPSRRQALPSLNQQLRTVQQAVQQLALCHPQVTWQAELSDRPWFSFSPGQTARDLLPQMVKSIAVSDLRDIHQPLPAREETPNPTQESTSQLYLLLGLPDRCHRRRPDWIQIAVNGRPVQLPELEQSLLRSLRFTLPRDRYPVAFLHLHTQADQVDWNRHPHKATLYLRHLPRWTEAIQQAVQQILRLHPESLSPQGQQQRLTPLIKAAEAAGGYGRPPLTPPAVNLSDPLPDNSLAFQSPSLPVLTAVAQVQNRYILAEHADGICLIEQHIAHERVLYERLSDRWEVVPLPTPVTLERLTPRQQEQLERLGLAVEPFGNQLWAVRQAPAPLAERGDLTAALMELSLGSDLDAALVATACRTAIRNGTPLTPTEMQALLADWQRTRNPHTCPHGRPICLTLPETSLARFFRRHWVIGKSHGLEP